MAPFKRFCRPLATLWWLPAMLTLLLLCAGCNAFGMPVRTRDAGSLRILLDSTRCGEAPLASWLSLCCALTPHVS